MKHKPFPSLFRVVAQSHRTGTFLFFTCNQGINAMVSDSRLALGFGSLAEATRQLIGLRRDFPMLSGWLVEPVLPLPLPAVQPQPAILTVA